MTYNITELQGAETVIEITEYANNATSGTFIGSLVFALFFIMIYSFYRWGLDIALTTSGLICFVLSAMLAYNDWISLYYPLAFLAITAFSGLYMYVTRK